MTPKEKANVLHTLMYGDLHNNMTWQEAKRCALIAVDEIIQELEHLKHTEDCNEDVFDSYQYWEKVKLELEKL